MMVVVTYMDVYKIRKGGASYSQMLRAKITEVSISANPSVPDLWLPRSTCTETGRFEMNTPTPMREKLRVGKW